MPKYLQKSTNLKDSLQSYCAFLKSLSHQKQTFQNLLQNDSSMGQLENGLSHLTGDLTLSKALVRAMYQV